MRNSSAAFARALGLAAALAGAARAQDTIALGAFDLTPTIHSAGFVLPFTGDDDGDAAALVEYRVLGSPALPALLLYLVVPGDEPIFLRKDGGSVRIDLAH